MRIVDLLKKESIELKAKADSKAQAIDKLIALQAAGGAISMPIRKPAGLNSARRP